MVKEELSLPSVVRPSRTKEGLYFAGGGLICSSCRITKEKIGEEIIDCGLKEASDLQILRKGDWRMVERFALGDTETWQIHRLVMAFATYHTERKLPDWTTLTPYVIVASSMQQTVNNNNA